MLSELLAQRAAEGNPIRVGIIGSGKFGGGLIAQISRMQGMVVSAVADIVLENARNAYAISFGADAEIKEVESVAELNKAVDSGRFAVTQDGLLLAQADGIDVVVEGTGVPEAGARMAFETLTHGKHLVMVNVETDVTIGPLLRRLADSAGVVYTLVDGDQPGVTMNIIEWATSLGFEIVAAGRGTIFFGDDRAGTPDTVPERFGFSAEMIERRTINLKMFNSFRDGTKAPAIPA